MSRTPEATWPDLPNLQMAPRVSHVIKLAVIMQQKQEMAGVAYLPSDLVMLILEYAMRMSEAARRLRKPHWNHTRKIRAMFAG